MPRKKTPAATASVRKKTAGKKDSKADALRKARMKLFLTSGEKALGKSSREWQVLLDPDQLKESLPHIPTGSLVIDYLIGGEPNMHGVPPCPGLPRGRVSQVWGHESAGKTTLALTAAATVCKRNGSVLYIDWENDIVPDYAEALGVPVSDPERFILAQPDTLEDGLKLAMVAAAAGLDLIVFDSVGAAVTARIATRGMEEVGEQSKVGDLQAVWSQELPNLKGKIAKSGTHVMGISQIRAKISTGGGGHGPKTQPQGGNAWKFYSSVRLELRRIKMEKSKEYNTLKHRSDDRVTGGIINCKVVKCKLSKSQGREETFYIRWGEGIDDIRSVMEIGKAHGVIKKSGAWLQWEGPGGLSLNQNGTNSARKYLKENKEVFQALYNAVIPFLGSRQVAEEELEDLEGLVEMLASEADELQDGPDLSEVEVEVEVKA